MITPVPKYIPFFPVSLSYIAIIEEHETGCVLNKDVPDGNIMKLGSKNPLTPNTEFSLFWLIFNERERRRERRRERLRERRRERLRERDRRRGICYKAHKKNTTTL